MLGVAAVSNWGSVPGLSLATGGNPGPVPYVSAANTLSEDATNFCWDASNHRLGIGTCAPSAPLQVGSVTISSNASVAAGQFGDALSGAFALAGAGFGGVGLRFNSSLVVNWSSGSLGTPDTDISRIAAGTVGAGTGATGSTAGTFKAASFQGGDAAPAPTACGTSPAVAASSSTFGGSVTEGTAATGCVVTFATSPSRCVLSSESGLVFTYSLSGAVLTIVNVGALSSTNIDWVCTK